MASDRIFTAAARLRALFAEREIFLRSQGKVRFVRISSRAQIIAASLMLLAVLGWAGTTMAMAWNQWRLAEERAAMAAQAKSVSAQARTVARYKRSVGDIAADLDRRQDALDEMVRSQFGKAALEGVVIGQEAPTAPGEESKGAPAAKGRTISQATPAEGLRAAERRQIAFARRLAALVDARAARVEAAIRGFGLNPGQIARAGAQRGAQGGPFQPWSIRRPEDDAALTTLAVSLERLNALEGGLLSIPSGQPTQGPMLTSSFGYRRDPFNGRPAFHAGVDFPGRYGQPILAAAAGSIAYVGGRQGYGNVVEIDHGNGMMTRYAHLSGFSARAGQRVAKGDAIGRMGSTGRSTGTHLHFEVRVNGAAINPRRFLEARQDVLQVQQIARQRIGNGRG